MQAVDPARATGREARTDFKVLHTDGLISLMECRLFTGRTHQIRVHLQKLGFPIVGDKIYGGRPAPGCERVMLHAWQLSFTHPRIGKLVECKAPIPDDLKRAVAPFKPDAGIRTSVSGRKTTKR
jgi:23S rRNA pseudouridine1911/1915/1917 synthase